MDGGTVLKVGIFKTSDDIVDGFVKGCVYVALVGGLVRIVVEGGLDV